MSKTMGTIAAIVLLFFCGTLSAGSVRRVEISKSTESDSPIEFSVAIRPDPVQPGHVSVELALPSGQQELADLWKIYLWIVEDKRTVLGAPLDVKRERRGKDNTIIEMITVNYHGHVDTVGRCLIAIRCGKHAPKSETIYQIDIGSYLNDPRKGAQALSPDVARAQALFGTHAANGEANKAASQWSGFSVDQLAEHLRRNGLNAAEPEIMTGLPTPDDVFVIAVAPHPKEMKDYFTPDSLLKALPKFMPSDVLLPIGDRVWWQSGVIVLKDKTVLFWRTCGDWFIAIDSQEARTFYAMPRKDDPNK